MKEFPKGGLIGKVMDAAKTVKQMHIPLHAAYAAYFIILAFFPALVLILSVLRYTGMEVRGLVEQGYKDITLLGQNVNSYGKNLEDEISFAQLLQEVEKIDKIKRIRFMTSHPKDLSDELIEVMKNSDKICRHLHLPLQSGSTKILKAMNRRDTKESIRKVFRDLRERIPGLVLRTSIIAGLPGEGEAEFEELCDFLREEKIERAGVFPFSPEEGTKAATMEHVPTEEAQRRTELLVDVQSDIIDEYNESVLGDVREVLCEGWSEEAQSFVGRSYAESVDIDGKIYFSAERDIMAGEFVNVRLTGTMDGELTGEAVE